MKKEKPTIPVNLFPFGFADDVSNWQHYNDEMAGRCVEAISKSLEPTAEINRNITSPALKKVIEAQLGEAVSNGVFIAAMVEAGYRYERVKCTPNCYFNAVLKQKEGSGSLP